MDFWQALENAIEIVEGDELIIVGDFNVNVLADDNWQKSHLIDFMDSFNLRNTVNSATRTTAKSKTCIDLILTDSSTHHATYVQECALSDHDLVVSFFGKVSPNAGLQKSELVTIRNYKYFSMEIFRQLLLSSGITTICSDDSESVDSKWSTWSSLVLTVLDTVAPIKMTCPRKRRCPFMTTELLEIIHERKRIYRFLQKPGSDRASLFPVYRRLRNNGNTLYRQLRNSYYQNCCQRYSTSPKQLWNVIRSMSGRSKPKLKPLPDPDSLNSFFADLVSDSSATHVAPCGPEDELHFTEFPVISVERVQKMLESVDPGKAPGSDDILPSLLRGCADMLAPSLTSIFNQSMRSGIVPAGFKIANITPLLKSSKLDATLPVNYRGISLLPVASKLLERIVQDELVSHFEYGNVLNDLQFGFRHGRSTEDLLAKAVSDWSRNLDNGLTTVVAFIDLSKAFDKVKHQSLLVTLQQCGVGGTVLQWLASYLNDRHQRVCVDSTMGKCPLMAVQQGVPQGSILGPLLFNLCLAHLPKLVMHNFRSTILLLFADDKTLYAAHKSAAEAASVVSKALNLICNDVRPRGLSFNLEKTVFMVIGPPTITMSISVSVKCGDRSLEQVSKHRCLGVLIDNQLSWCDHVKYVSAKVAQRIGCLRRIWRQLSEKARRLYFIAVIQPCLEYCSVITCTQIKRKDRDRLQRLYRRGIRAVYGSRYDADVRPLMERLQLRPLEERWLLKLLVFAHRCLSPSGTSAAKCLSELFEYSVSRGRVTRGQTAGNVHIPWRNSARGRNAMDHRVAILWNSLPAELRSCASLYEFKPKLLQLLASPIVCERYIKLAFCRPCEL